MKKVLFVCVHNAARSQMAEAFLNKLGKDFFIAESAGLEPGELNPDIVDVMLEIGYDIHQNPTKSVFNFYKEGKRYHYVVKVCDQINGQKCPIFPATLKVLDWNHEDPSQYSGSKEERLVQARKLRDEIKHNVEEMIRRELLQATNFKALEKSVIKYITYKLNEKVILDIEKLSVMDDREVLTLGVSDAMFDHPRFKLEAYTSAAFANWILLMYGESMLKTNNLKAFSPTHLRGLLNNLVDYMKFSPNDIGLNVTACIQNYAYEKGFNVKTHYRSVRSGETLMLESWKEFAFNSLNEKVPLILIGQSDAHLVYGVEADSDLIFDVLVDGRMDQIKVSDWIKNTHNACLIRIDIE